MNAPVQAVAFATEPANETAYFVVGLAVVVASGLISLTSVLTASELVAVVALVLAMAKVLAVRDSGLMRTSYCHAAKLPEVKPSVLLSVPIAKGVVLFKKQIADMSFEAEAVWPAATPGLIDRQSERLLTDDTPKPAGVAALLLALLRRILMIAWSPLE
jgi:hypothetical protein